MTSFPGNHFAAESKAIVLSGKYFSSDDRNVTQMLDCFGVPWEIAAIRQDGSFGTLPSTRVPKSCSLVSSASTLAQAFKALGGSPDMLAKWLKSVSHVYVYGFEETGTWRSLLGLLTSNKKIDVQGLPSWPTLISVTNDLPELCGPMLGLTVLVTPGPKDCVFNFGSGESPLKPIVRTNSGPVFARVVWRGITFFLNASAATINVFAPADEFFDVKKYFCSVVPLTLYLTWAFPELSRRSSETGACVMVDDPLLRSRYGFLDFRRALELMNTHDFTMSLAFIPWNWRRTRPETVKLFLEHPKRFSLCIHGCDHTKSEFAAQSTAELNARANIASQRMDSLQKETFLPHDRIMVFPQGKFSSQVGQVLKLNGFIAAVCTEVAPARKSENKTRIADLWDVAINCYGSFPIFTRRYIWHGIENFAFDILLGKPCLIAAHHDTFNNDARMLTNLIDRLNSLPCKLKWESLGGVVGKCFRTRFRPDGTKTLQMYSTRAFVRNPAADPVEIRMMKEESDHDCVSGVAIHHKDLQWSSAGHSLHFTFTVPARGTADVRVSYYDKLGEQSYPRTIGYTLKTGLRRHLSEIRDQYISRSNVLIGIARAAGLMPRQPI